MAWSRCPSPCLRFGSPLLLSGMALSLLAGCPSAPSAFHPADGGAPGAQCRSDRDCDDGLFCDGQESCNAGQCMAGTAPDCGQGWPACAMTSCDETSGSCKQLCPDKDGDGYVDIACGGACKGNDCDDSDPRVHPGAPEICDDKDNDCDGTKPWWDNASPGDGAGKLICQYPTYQQVTVTSSLATAAVAVQLPVDLDTHALVAAGALAPSCADLRFVSGDGSTGLPLFTEVCDPESGAPGSYASRWTFDSVAGALVRDENTTSANSGTLVGGASIVKDGALGSALRLDGASGYMVVADGTGLDPTRAMTLSAWVRYRGPGTSGTALDMIASKVSSLTLTLGLATNTSCGGGMAQGELLFYLNVPGAPSNSGACPIWSDAGFALPANVWTHVAVTYDGSAGQIRAYENGRLASLFVVAAGGSMALSSGGPLRVGAWPTTGGTISYYFKGDADDVRLYDTVLREDEIGTALRDRGRFWVTMPSLAAACGGTPTTTTLYAYYGDPSARALSSFDGVFTKDFDVKSDPTLIGSWHFDEGSGTSTADASLSGDAGTLVGATWVAMDGGVWWTRPDLSFSTGASLAFLPSATAYVNLGNPPALAPASALTLEAWAEPSSPMTSGGQAVVARGNLATSGDPLTGNDVSYFLGLDPAGQVDFITGHSGGAQTAVLTPETLPSGAWAHLVGTWDGATASLYVDGDLRASKAVSGMIPSDAADATVGAVVIAGVPQGLFAGSIDDVKIYARALSAAEVFAHAERRNPVSPVPTVTAGAATPMPH